jgi:aspartyl-tRNA(Asn)/glutamyl-tRNA(Gln) amidotransferase subunit A
VEDAALVLQCIAGYDRLDLQSIEYPVPDYLAALTAAVSQFRIGVAPMFFDGVDSEVAEAVQKALEVLSGITKGCCEIQMPNVLGTGAGSEGAVYREILGNSFTVPLGSPATPPAGANAGSGRAVDYIREWRQLRLLRRTVNEEVFEKHSVDLVVTPTVRHLPWSIEEELGRLASARARHPEPGNTRSIDDYGLPTITLPCGYSKAGLPIGLQISGPNRDEGRVLALAHAFERATGWRSRRPTLAPDAKSPALSPTAASQTGEALNR